MTTCRCDCPGEGVKGWEAIHTVLNRATWRTAGIQESYPIPDQGSCSERGTHLAGGCGVSRRCRLDRAPTGIVRPSAMKRVELVPALECWNFTEKSCLSLMCFRARACLSIVAHGPPPLARVQRPHLRTGGIGYGMTTWAADSWRDSRWCGWGVGGCAMH